MDDSQDYVRWPAGLVQAQQELWRERVEDTPALRMILGGVRTLRNTVLTGTMVVGDFVRRRLSPLRS